MPDEVSQYTVHGVQHRGSQIDVAMLIQDSAGNKIMPIKVETTDEYDLVLTLPGVLTEPGPDYHVIDFAGDGYTLKHPLACRPNLFDCALHQAAAAEQLHHTTEALGRFRCELVDGRVMIGERVE